MVKPRSLDRSIEGIEVSTSWKKKKKGGIEVPGSIAKNSFHEGSCKYTPSLERENRRRGMHAWNPAMIDQ